MTNYKLRITNWFAPKYKYLTKNKSENYFLTITKYFIFLSNKFFCCSNLLIIFILLSQVACKTSKSIVNKSDNNSTKTDIVKTEKVITKIDTLSVNKKLNRIVLPYKPSNNKKNKLYHTKLDINISFEKKQLDGKAYLTLSPYYYSTSRLIIDAKNFEIKSVKLIKNKRQTNLNYNYDSSKINIELNKTYKQNEKYTICIDYKVKYNPGSNKNNKGLNFINYISDNKKAIKQIWASNTTHSASSWFPTIDSPNQKTTQEIYITVDNKYRTISNGIMDNTLLNKNGTRTDYWKQNKALSPHLSMIVVGEFSEIKDYWQDMKVLYYINPEYANNAKAIFKKTPKMIEFFSRLFKIDYPWKGYKQIIVKDNFTTSQNYTSATIFNEQIQLSNKELNDKNNEALISHNVACQWFGSYITAESWANIALCKSLSTYSEYLWFEKEYGKQTADYYLYKLTDNYLIESKSYKKPLIRFYRLNNNYLFDKHTYNKGAAVIHMLRNYVGDKAFFDAINLFLTKHKYSNVEIHDLRLAFEEITGEDLNWFFNQWFLKSGHPILDINYNFKNNILKISIEQKQNIKESCVFTLPLKIDIHTENQIIRKKIIINKQKQIFEYKIKSNISFINFDAEKALLCEKIENKTTDNLINQYNSSKLFLDKYETLEALKNKPDTAKTRILFLKALNYKFWKIRDYAINQYPISKWKNDLQYIAKLENIAKNDKNSNVRASAVLKLSYIKSEKNIKLLSEIAITDKSYKVQNIILTRIKHLSKEESLKLADRFINDKLLSDKSISIYSDFGNAQKADYFEKVYHSIDISKKWSILINYAEFVIRFDDKVINKALKFYENLTLNAKVWWIKVAAYQSIQFILNYYSTNLDSYKNELKQLSNNPEKKNNIEKKISLTQKKVTNITKLINSVKKKETDERVINY